MAGLFQSQYVELEVLQRHSADLTSVIATDPALFGQHLVTRGFAARVTVDSIVGILGVSDYQKGTKLLGLVDSKVRTAGTRENTRKYFNDFLMIISGPMGHRNIAESLVTTFQSKDPCYMPPWTREQVPSWPTPSTSSGGGQRFNDRDYVEIYQKLCSHAHEWRKIGRGLGFTINEMDTIQNMPLLIPRGPSGYLEQLLSQWLQWAPSDGRGKGFATRESLIAGLIEVKLGVLAEKFGHVQASKPPPEPPTSAEPQPGNTVTASSSGASLGAIEMPPESLGDGEPARVQIDDGEMEVENGDVAGGASCVKKREDPEPKETPQYDMKFAKDIKKSSEMTEQQERTLMEEHHFRNTVTVIIAAVNDDEVRAIRHFMQPLKDYGIPTLLKHTTGTSMILGTIGGCNAVLVRIEMGSKCQGDVKEALKEFPKARAVIAVGVAYGASRKYEFCDVLVSKEIYGYATTRLNEDGTVDARDLTVLEQSQFQKKLINAFTHSTDDWNGEQCTKQGRQASVYTGTITSMSMLVDNEQARDSLVQTVPKMIGGEMEGHGLLQIQQEFKGSREIGIMIVKGISDFADGSKDKRWQLTAAITAANYVDQMIRDNQRRLFKPQDIAAEQ